MIALDYLLIAELLVLLAAGIFYAIGEWLGRENPRDELRRTMRRFWREVLARPRGETVPMVLESGAADDDDEAVFSKPAQRGKSAETGCVLTVKVVPGASRSQIMGMLGEDVKIQVSAAPEGGEANKAVIDLLADALDLKGYQIKLIRGHYQPRKTLQISGLTSEQVQEKLAKHF